MKKIKAIRKGLGVPAHKIFPELSLQSFFLKKGFSLQSLTQRKTNASFFLHKQNEKRKNFFIQLAHSLKKMQELIRFIPDYSVPPSR